MTASSPSCAGWPRGMIFNPPAPLLPPAHVSTAHGISMSPSSWACIPTYSSTGSQVAGWQPSFPSVTALPLTSSSTTTPRAASSASHPFIVMENFRPTLRLGVFPLIQLLSDSSLRRCMSVGEWASCRALCISIHARVTTSLSKKSIQRGCQRLPIKKRHILNMCALYAAKWVLDDSPGIPDLGYSRDAPRWFWQRLERAVLMLLYQHPTPMDNVFWKP